MATPPLTQLSAPPSPSPSPAGTSTYIPIADGGIPSLPSTTTEQQQSDATAGSTVIQVESEQPRRQTTGGTSRAGDVLRVQASIPQHKEDDAPFIFKVVGSLLKMLLGYMATSLSMLLLYGIYFRPYAVRPMVDAAALAAFDLTPGPGDNTMLRYDLALNVTFFNDHRIWAIRFNHFTARLYFNGTQVSPPDDTFPKFKGRLRRHRTVHPVLRGRASNVSAAVAEDFSCQRAQGWFTVQVKLRATLTYVIWPTWYVYYYEYDCWLHFPSNAMPAVIGGVKCSKGKQFALS